LNPNYAEQEKQAREIIQRKARPGQELADELQAALDAVALRKATFETCSCGGRGDHGQQRR
jgi:hypothetical protein